MTWMCIRTATMEDSQRLIERVKAFGLRHNIFSEEDLQQEFFNPEHAIEDWFEMWRSALDKYPPEYYYYKRVRERALQEKGAEDIAYGYVGYHVKE